MSAGVDRQRVGQVRCRQYRRSRHVRGARKCERIDFARRDREAAAIQMRNHDLPGARHHRARGKGSILAATSWAEHNAVCQRVGQPSPFTACSPSQSTVGRRLAAEDHRDPGQICARSVSPANESDQLPGQDREASRCADHYSQLEHDRESGDNSQTASITTKHGME